jgi:hypothetical protein
MKDAEAQKNSDEEFSAKDGSAEASFHKMDPRAGDLA